MDYFNDILDENLDDFLKQYKLTPPAINTIKKMFRGKSSKEIGEELFIAEKTAKFHLTNVYKRIECRGRSEMFYLFIKFLIYKYDTCLVKKEKKEKIVKKEETILCRGREN